MTHLPEVTVGKKHVDGETTFYELHTDGVWVGTYYPDYAGQSEAVIDPGEVVRSATIRKALELAVRTAIQKRFGTQVDHIDMS